MTTCTICNKNEVSITCTNPDCNAEFCVPCSKVYNEGGKINPYTKDSLVFACPKCKQPIKK